jgi:methanogenic corrinoid protein MtbC1
MKARSPLPAPMTISAVERDTGLGKDTLRVWERRYAFPTPLRHTTGERLYPADQVEKLRLIKRLMDQGHRPGKLLALSPAGLQAIYSQVAPAATTPAAEGRQAILSVLVRSDSEGLRAALGQALMRQGLQRFVVDTLAPLNGDVGEAWMRGEIGVHQEHLYTEQVQNLLRGAINALPIARAKPRVLLATVPEEAHVLGLLMAEAMLASEGADCVSLGTQTPLHEIRDAALAGRFDVVALSFSAAFPTRHALTVLRELRSLLPAQTEIWAGGRSLQGKGRQLSEARLIGPIEEVLTALRAWRDGRR